MCTALLLGNLCGCAMSNQAEEIQQEEIELVEPVGVAVSYDVAMPRDLYEAEVYSCVCAPAVTELSYNTDLPFKKYGKLPGETVTSGDIKVWKKR